MTFLYTSSVIVEELKAAVLSKTKPNKPEKQAEGLELSPSREVKLGAPAPATALPVPGLPGAKPQCRPRGPVSAVSPKGQALSQPQKYLCLKADLNNLGVLSHLLLWRNVWGFLRFRFWFGLFVCLFGGLVFWFFLVKVAVSLLDFIILSRACSKQAATAQRLLRNLDLQLLAGI